MKRVTLVDIARDPNGVYIARDGALNLYWYNSNACMWIELRPEDYGTVLQ